MKIQKWLLVVGVLVLFGAVALTTLNLFAPAALAQGPMGGPGSRGAYGPMADDSFGPQAGMGPGYGAGPMFGRGGQWGGPTNSLVAVAADELGLTQAELIAELQAGKTIADVAAEHGVAVETIVEAFLAPRAERLAELVANGQLTQEEADAWLATMRTRVTERISQPWSPQGRGQGAGFVDEDGDGICDHAGQGGPGGRYGGGRMMGRWGW